MMAEKVHTVVIKGNLDCPRCCKKIRKVLCKFPEREKIQSQTFDEKQKTVTVSGTFNPQCLICKLRCKAGKSISSIEIKEPGKEKESGKPDPKPSPESVEKPKKNGDGQPPKDADGKAKESPLLTAPTPTPSPMPVLMPVAVLVPEPRQEIPVVCCEACYDRDYRGRSSAGDYYCSSKFFSAEDPNCRIM